MIKQLQKVGNSNAIVLDRAVMELMGLEERGKVQMTLSEGSLVVTPVAPRRPDAAKFEAALDHVVASRRTALRRLAE